MLRCVIIIITYIAACRANLFSISPEELQHSNDIKIATIVHNTPSAVSHTTFTRVHNHHIGGATQHAPSTHLPITSTTPPQAVTLSQTPSVNVQPPIYTTHQLNAISQTITKPGLPALQIVDSVATEMTALLIKDDTPIVQPLTHTPAHLTFAAQPVVYQMLPEIKPVRKISFDEVVPSPRNAAKHK